MLERANIGSGNDGGMKRMEEALAAARRFGVGTVMCDSRGM